MRQPGWLRDAPGRRAMRKAVRGVLIAAILIVVILVAGVAPFLLLTPRAPRPPAGIDNVEKLEAYLGALTAKRTPPALQVTVLKDGAVAYSKAFGIADGPTNRPAGAKQVYHFWSVTKLFTATAIMQLVEDRQGPARRPADQISARVQDGGEVGRAGRRHHSAASRAHLRHERPRPATPARLDPRARRSRRSERAPWSSSGSPRT